MEIYKSGESLILNEEEASMALRCQEQHLEVSPKEGMIREYFGDVASKELRQDGYCC